MEMQRKQLVISDQLINYYQFGDGNKTLIMIHGWRSSADAWFGVASQFADQEMTIYCLDMPGFGGSPAPKKPFAISDYSRIVEGFMEKLGLFKTILIGHSFGGRIAIKLAATNPSAIEKLVLADSAGIKKDNRSREVLAQLAKPFFKPSFMQGLKSKIYYQLGAEDYLATPELKETYLNVIKEDLSPYLFKIEAETLIIWGRNDNETPVADARAMHQAIKRSKLHVLEGAGHFCFIDKPDEFVRSVLTFIKP